MLTADPIISQRWQWVDAQMSTPAISPNAVSQFLCEANATTQGVDVSFSLTDITGMSSLSLVRATVMDIAQGTVLQSWTATVSSFTWSDTDSILQAAGQAFYWIKLEPVNSTGSEVVAGPQYLLLNPSLLPLAAATSMSASHAAASNGAVLVTCNIAGIPAGATVRIGVTGYEGNASQVIVSAGAKAPLQFNLAATGETVTLQAFTVSSGGAPSLTGPACTLTLNGTATAPAQVQGISVAQIPTGNQVMWPASVEAGVTGYQLWRGQRGDAFALATLFATIVSTGEGSVEYLDTGGLGGDYQYFVISVSTPGNSPVSAPANPQILFSSVLLPTNATANTTNTCVLDSIDAGTTDTIRIYGPGGVGTSYTRQLGFGTVTRPSGSIVGLAYGVRYYVIYTGAAYLASTSYSDSLPDGYEWVGTLVTCPHGGTPGSGAAATATCSSTIPYQLTNISVTAGGYGYGSASASVAGYGGAVLHVNSAFGVVLSISILSYTGGPGGSPAVTITCTSNYTGGGGSGSGGSRYQLSQ